MSIFKGMGMCMDFMILFLRGRLIVSFVRVTGKLKSFQTVFNKVENRCQ